MFCDLVGSTALSARLDPEDMREIIGAYHRCCAEIITRSGGFVGRYIGDGVLAYYGYPQTYEDDAERAVRAGLALVDGVSRLEAGHDATLQVRIGIATGVVVVGDLIGEGAAQERGVVGDTPNLAARLQALAEPGQIVISQDTRRLTAGLFDYHDLGRLAIKGLAEPVQAWQVLRTSGVESRFEAQHETSLTPLVGREEELELLLRRWRQALQGEGRVVLISGEPGIGKSRVIAELQERLQSEPHTRLRHFCSPHHQDSAFYPVIAQLERAARFKRHDTAEAKLDKLASLFGSRSGHENDIRLFAELVSIPTGDRYGPLNWSPQRKKQRTIEALLTRLELLSRRQPVFMVYEDVHWIDPSTHELLDTTVERVASLPVLLVITFRPEFQAPWTGQAHVSTVSLARLGRREGTVLVARVAGENALPAETMAEIMERTDGIPLFVEELTKAVVEGGVRDDGAGRTISAVPLASSAVPATLYASLMARLDRLGPLAKEIAQISAAIGRTFSYELLAPIAEKTDPALRTALGRLADAGLVFCRGTPPEATLMFKHALVRDAAYSSLLRGQRQQLHLRIARVLEDRFQEAAEARPEVLAGHFAQAGLAKKAIAYCLKAGQRATTLSAMPEALAQLTKGLELLSALPDDAERRQQELELRIALGKALIAAKGYAAPETGRAYARARELCHQLGDSSQLFAVLRGQYVFHNVRAELRAARELGEQLLDLARRDQDPAHLVEAHRVLGHTLLFLGEFAAARAQVRQGLALCDPPTNRPDTLLYGQHSGVACLSSAAYGLWFLGFPDRALATSREAVSWAKKLSHPFSLAFALYYGSQVRRLRREAHDMDELMTLTSEQGFVYWSTVGTVNEGWALAMQGAPATGIAQMRQGLAAHRATGAALYGSEHLVMLAEAQGKGGQPVEGLQTLSEALAFVDHTGEGYFAAELHRLKGELLLLQDRSNPAPAEAAYCTAVEISHAQRAKSWELRTATSLARLWRDQGKRTEARDLLAPIYGWFTEGFDTPDLKEARALLDELYQS